ncbi:MAG: sporulation protein YqfC [Syntrophomonadaceae bacterium]|nr:sporulation protein YqfC [Syntrophomonadaceae bacterium]
MRLGKERVGQTIAHVMELPRDLVLDVPRITMVGREEMHLENHKGIIEYGPGHLKINLNRGYLEIYGEGLEIAVLRTEEMLITGRIQDIRFAE